MHFYPVFAYSMNTFNKDMFDEIGESLIVRQSSKYFDNIDIDFEEFEHEIKAYVAQIINLMQTVIDQTKDKVKMLS